jgi:hypothetical protein
MILAALPNLFGAAAAVLLRPLYCIRSKPAIPLSASRCYAPNLRRSELASLYWKVDVRSRARWFALINIPRHMFSQATAEAAKRKNERFR